jgi:hypothetical protein
MSICKDRAFEILKKISFERITGTDKELECAHIIEEECKKVGLDFNEFRLSEFWVGGFVNAFPGIILQIILIPLIITYEKFFNKNGDQDGQ